MGEIFAGHRKKTPWHWTRALNKLIYLLSLKVKLFYVVVCWLLLLETDIIAKN